MTRTRRFGRMMVCCRVDEDGRGPREDGRGPIEVTNPKGSAAVTKKTRPSLRACNDGLALIKNHTKGCDETPIKQGFEGIAPL